MTEKAIAWIARTESETFSDAWSAAMLEDTLRYDYNRIFVIYLPEQGIETDGENAVCCPIAEYRESDGVLCGYLAANTVADESELLRIAVGRAWRGRGFGRRLMEAYHENIPAKRYLLEVRAGNESARALYELFGYTVLGIRKHYYKNPTEDGVLYERKG